MDSKYLFEGDDEKLRKMRARAERFHRRRVKIVKLLEGQGISIEEHEHKLRIGMVGTADSLHFDGEPTETITVVFNDGCRLRCLPKELEICIDSNNKPLPKIPLHSNSQRNKPPTRYVQSCISHVGFPSSVNGFLSILERDGETDIENLMWPDKSRTNVGWTAPRWMTSGDIMFFYHTKQAAKNLDQLIRTAAKPFKQDWNKAEDPESAIHRICEQYDLAQLYAGTIFGCALVTGDAALERGEVDHDRHFRGRIFASIGREFMFARPIPDHGFQDIVKISPGGAITPLHGTSFTELKKLIRQHNDIPDYLAAAEAGGVSFRDVNATNWMDISCSGTSRFIDESQLRTYMADYLLEAIKDPKTQVHEESHCAHTGSSPTFADYFVRLGGNWIAVETKLNIKVEADIRRQISTYLNIEEFCPTRTKNAGEFVRGPTSSICLVIDAQGLYLMNRQGFIGSAVDQPIWKLKQLTPATLPEIREKVIRTAAQNSDAK